MSREMKDSGIPWIGEVPKDWYTHRLKSIFTSRVSGEWGDDEQHNSQDRVCLRIADFDYSPKVSGAYWEIARELCINKSTVADDRRLRVGRNSELLNRSLRPHLLDHRELQLC